MAKSSSISSMDMALTPVPRDSIAVMPELVVTSGLSVETGRFDPSASLALEEVLVGIMEGLPKDGGGNNAVPIG